MKQVIHRTAAAERDYDAIFDYIAPHNLNAACRLLDTIDAKLRDYAWQPGMGTARENFGLGLKSFHVKSYVVFYRPVKDGIQLVRVLHGARKIDRSFFE